MYARQALEYFGWWEALESRLAPAADVRGALRFVETGQTQRGVVYTTDAAASDKVQVVAIFPARSHSPIRYPAAIVKGASNASTKAFLDFLQGSQAARIFRKHGFEVLQDAN
jgi:molybdate transport system substrate-binding protein